VTTRPLLVLGFRHIFVGVNRIIDGEHDHDHLEK
jgi:hypothetical protein